MSRRGRNVSHDNQRSQVQAVVSSTNKMVSRGISPNISRNDIYRKGDTEIFLSGGYIKEKTVPRKQVRYIYGSSQNQKQVIKQTDFQKKRQQEEQEIGLNEHSYGDLSGLKRKRYGRRNYYYRKAGTDKEESALGIIIKKSQQTRPEVIQKNQLNKPQSPQQELNQQISIEQLHYQMVKMQLKCKNAFRD